VQVAPVIGKDGGNYSVEEFLDWGKQLVSFAAFIAAYLFILRPALKVELGKDFEPKGFAESSTKAHRDEVHGIVARWELERTLRVEGMNQRFSNNEGRILNLEEDRDINTRETQTSLSDIKTMLARIDERIKHIENKLQQGDFHG
jgi:hypothetical protein